MLPNLLIIILLLSVLICINEVATTCGKVDVIEGRILGGQQTLRGEWPFTVALYYTEKSNFFCGGTLISSKNVLTAAHCVQQKNSAQRLVPEDVLVLLGRHDLSMKVERGSLQRDVDEIHVHPDWKIFSDKYDADLAVFVLRETVGYTHYIRAVCLPTDDDDEDIVDVEGDVVGWGVAENTKANNHESIPRHGVTTILNDTYCYTMNPIVAIFASPRTFCGSGSATPNSGDSGGGFFILSGSSWTQYGIISSSLSDEHGLVQAHTVTVYTNVKMFKNWIEETVQKTGGELTAVISRDGGDKQKIDLNCNYETVGDTIYKCSLHALDVKKENLEVVSFTGSNIAGHTANDVNDIWFWHGTLLFIPDGIGKLFNNLQHFYVGYEGRNLGLKLVKRSNFKKMPNLEILFLYFNEIETIDEDTLRDLSKLQNFNMQNNKIKVLHKRTFAKNTQLKFVNVKSNQLEYLHEDLFKTNLLLESAIFSDNKLTKIYTDFTKLTHISDADFHRNICIDKSLQDVQTVLDFQNILSNQCGAK